jgi:hypothetical protein
MPVYPGAYSALIGGHLFFSAISALLKNLSHSDFEGKINRSAYRRKFAAPDRAATAPARAG